MDPSTRMLINSAGLVILAALLAFFAAKYWYGRKSQDEKTAGIAEATKVLTARVGELEAEHRLVKAAVVPITSAFQAILIKELTHFHTPEMDALMAKLTVEAPPVAVPPVVASRPAVLTEEEEARLAVLLEERTRDMGELISESEREAAMILPIVMKRARAEAAAIDKESKLAVVAIPHQVLNNDK